MCAVSSGNAFGKKFKIVFNFNKFVFHIVG